MADDLEAGEKRLDRRTSWIARFPSTLPNVPFYRSNTSTTVSTTRTLSMDMEQFENLPSLTVVETRHQDRLISIIVGDEARKGTLATACSWYCRFLQSKFRSHWHLLAPSLVGLYDASTTPTPGDLVVVYNFVITVAQLLKTRQQLALVDIVDELDNENLLKPQLDEERAMPNQIVFAAVGWLSMLYEAVSHPKPDKLEVTKTSTSSSGARNALDTRKYYTFHQGFDHIDLPFYSLLGRFGDLIPETKLRLSHELGYTGSIPGEVVMVQSVCFSTLHHLTELNIEWVSSLALHLELDSGKKTLKLFQYPSFCRMMAIERKNNLLSRLLNDHAAQSCEDVRPPDIHTEDLFEEILLSYRLIFGQDERSWKAFSSTIPPSSEQQALTESSWSSDPLLYVLCGKSCISDESRRIYHDIDANEPANYYNPQSEFPFFGKRLLDLQQFVKQHQPQTVRSLLNDRRDVAVWWTLWNNQLLVFFATFTILIMVLSLFFQIWQVILAKQQLQQGLPQ